MRRGYSTYPLSKEGDRFTNLPQTCLYAVIICRDGQCPRLLFPLKLVENDLVLDTSTFRTEIVSIVDEVVKRDLGHCRAGEKGVLLPNHWHGVKKLFSGKEPHHAFHSSPRLSPPLNMAVLSLPLSFSNSFWTHDYRNGLEVLYNKLEQVCAYARLLSYQDSHILTCLRARQRTWKLSLSLG